TILLFSLIHPEKKFLFDGLSEAIDYGFSMIVYRQLLTAEDVFKFKYSVVLAWFCWCWSKNYSPYRNLPTTCPYYVHKTIKITSEIIMDIVKKQSLAENQNRLQVRLENT